MYRVFARRKVIRRVQRMPVLIQKASANLVGDLKIKGPVRTEWPNFSRLSDTEYHCHLTYHWVACWRTQADEMEIEVYYAGSREDAPY